MSGPEVTEVEEDRWSLRLRPAGENDSLTGVLAKVADLATSTFPDYGTCGHQSRRHGTPEVGHAGHDDVATALEFIQHSVGEGPSVEALITGELEHR